MKILTLTKLSTEYLKQLTTYQVYDDYQILNLDDESLIILTEEIELDYLKLLIEDRNLSVALISKHSNAYRLKVKLEDGMIKEVNHHDNYYLLGAFKFSKRIYTKYIVKLLSITGEVDKLINSLLAIAEIKIHAKDVQSKYDFTKLNNEYLDLSEDLVNIFKIDNQVNTDYYFKAEDLNLFLATSFKNIFYPQKNMDKNDVIMELMLGEYDALWIVNPSLIYNFNDNDLLAMIRYCKEVEMMVILDQSYSYYSDHSLLIDNHEYSNLIVIEQLGIKYQLANLDLYYSNLKLSTKLSKLDQSLISFVGKWNILLKKALLQYKFKFKAMLKALSKADIKFEYSYFLSLEFNQALSLYLDQNSIKYLIEDGKMIFYPQNECLNQHLVDLLIAYHSKEV